MIRLASLALLALSATSPAAAQASRPRVVVRDESAIVAGLPAISGDGRTVVEASVTEDRSGAASLGVTFSDVATGHYVRGWQVFSRDEAGHYLDLGDDAHGDTPWRRARNLTLELEVGGYVSLTELTSATDVDSPSLSGAGLRLAQRGALVIVTDGAGRERLHRRLPTMSAFCGMSDDAPHAEVPQVLAAWAEVQRRVVLLRYGITYASCMCDDEIVSRTLRLRP